MILDIMKNKLYTFNTSELDDPGLYSFWYGQMNAARRKKIDAFKFDKDKKLSLAAGILLHKALDEIGITGYEILKGEREKPYLKGHEEIFFNLSHSGNMAALGISDREIGVDIEKQRHFEDSLIRYVFTERERELAVSLAASKNIPYEAQPAAGKEIAKAATAADASIDENYTRFWTAKESIMKHSGLGIALEPKKIELSVSGMQRGRPGEGEPCGGGIGETFDLKSSLGNKNKNRSEEDFNELEKSLKQSGKGAEIQPQLSAFCADYDCNELKLTSFRFSDYQLTICSEYCGSEFILSEIP